MKIIKEHLPAISQKAADAVNNPERIERAVTAIDRSVRLMTMREFKSGNDVVDNSRGPIAFGLWVLFVVFGVFGLWAACAPLTTAAVAPGSVILDSNKRTIQHLEGGIIEEILVKEGDFVEANQPLIRLDETNAKARNDIVLGQLRAAKANEIRLIAERDKKDELVFDDPLLADKENPDVQLIIDTQTRLFEARKKALEGQISVLNQKIKQLQEEIIGLESQETSAKKQLSILNEEIETVETLVKKGQALKPRLLALQRQATEVGGRQGEYQAMVARAKQSITEAEVEIINAETARQNEVSKELRDIQAAIADYSERLKAAEDVMNRLIIAAPQSGVVTGLIFHTKGGVISPGTPIMDIVPRDDKLIIESRVALQDIDVVHAGLPARIRLVAYKLRKVPTLDGTVKQVSADKFVDKSTGAAFYLARVEINQDELDELKSVELYPGMPADVLIVTGERTLLSYLFNPITDSFFHAFKEQ